MVILVIVESISPGWHPALMGETIPIFQRGLVEPIIAASEI